MLPSLNMSPKLFDSAGAKLLMGLDKGLDFEG